MFTLDTRPARIAILSLVLSACAGGGQVFEEKTTDVDGMEVQCGEGPGLSPCLDAQGQTYEQAANPDAYYGTEDDEELDADGKRMRNEDPEQFEKTTEELESEQDQ